VTELKQSFWPASDFHPTHNLYPEFDPKKPIAQNSSWVFVFDKSGKWTYHNHLFPSQIGTIIVLNKNGIVEQTGSPCNTNPNQQQCWSDQINQALNTEGLSAAFEKVKFLYGTQSQFASNCHAYAHKLGEAAYQLLAQNKPVPLSDAASYCGYGFYHGLMEKLLLNENDMVRAGDFCGSVYKDQNIVSGDACYHGIGHGAEALAVSDPGVWREPDKMFSNAVSICQVASRQDSVRFSRCSSGVFMEASSYYADGTYQLKFDKNNPISICADLQDKVKLNCYTQLYPVLKMLAGEDLAKAAKFVEQIKEDNYAQESIETLSGSMVNVQAKDHKKDIAVCRGMQARLKLYCIKGLAVGFLLNSTPGQMFERTSEFCKNSGLTKAEETACYDVAQRQAKDSSSESEIKAYCKEIPEIYRNEICK
jgi:hypothetical protein